MQPEILQRFLESVGQKADVDLYLRLFRSQRRESFAILSVDSRIVAEALDTLHFDLRILGGLGLTPVVLLGLYEPTDADGQAARVQEWLQEDSVPSTVVSGGQMDADVVERIKSAIQGNVIPLVSLQSSAGPPVDVRYTQLGKLATALETRKVVFLTTSAGLERRGEPRLSVVNLQTDYERLSATGVLSRRRVAFLRDVRELLDRVPQRMSVAVTTPLLLLRELFTVRGAGTLIKRGSRIERHDNLDTLDQPRLVALLESAFGKKLRPEALGLDLERVYLEESYRGAAVLRRTPLGPYLTKFAVERQAQGEGIGSDIWRVLVADYPAFFWRARPANPITPWYTTQCDGLVRLPEWHILWRGLPVDSVKDVVAYCLKAPVDFD